MKQVLIKMPDETYELISELAAKAGMTVQAYMITMSKDLMIYTPNYESIENHTKEISELKNDVGLILRTVNKTDEVYNADIQNILNILSMILKSEKQFLKRMDNDRKSNRNHITKVINKKLDSLGGDNHDS